MCIYISVTPHSISTIFQHSLTHFVSHWKDTNRSFLFGLEYRGMKLSLINRCNTHLRLRFELFINVWHFINELFWNLLHFNFISEVFKHFPLIASQLFTLLNLTLAGNFLYLPLKWQNRYLIEGDTACLRSYVLAIFATICVKYDISIF